MAETMSDKMCLSQWSFVTIKPKCSKVNKLGCGINYWQNIYLNGTIQKKIFSMPNLSIKI